MPQTAARTILRRCYGLITDPPYSVRLWGAQECHRLRPEPFWDDASLRIHYGSASLGPPSFAKEALSALRF